MGLFAMIFKAGNMRVNQTPTTKARLGVEGAVLLEAYL